MNLNNNSIKKKIFNGQNNAKYAENNTKNLRNKNFKIEIFNIFSKLYKLIKL